MINKRLIELLHQIERGTHDPTPTRMMPPLDNKIAWEVDSFWQDYYTSNDRSLKLLAREAISLLRNEGIDCPGCGRTLKLI